MDEVACTMHAVMSELCRSPCLTIHARSCVNINLRTQHTQCFDRSTNNTSNIGQATRRQTLPPERECGCVGSVEPVFKQVFCIFILIAKEFQEYCVHVLRRKLLQESHGSHLQQFAFKLRRFTRHVPVKCQAKNNSEYDRSLVVGKKSTW